MKFQRRVALFGQQWGENKHVIRAIKRPIRSGSCLRGKCLEVMPFPLSSARRMPKLSIQRKMQQSETCTLQLFLEEPKFYTQSDAFLKSFVNYTIQHQAIHITNPPVAFTPAQSPRQQRAGIRKQIWGINYSATGCVCFVILNECRRISHRVRIT
jgi:hypothetical protein